MLFLDSNEVGHVHNIDQLGLEIGIAGLKPETFERIDSGLDFETLKPRFARIEDSRCLRAVGGRVTLNANLQLLIAEVVVECRNVEIAGHRTAPAGLGTDLKGIDFFLVIILQLIEAEGCYTALTISARVFCVEQDVVASA